MSDARLASGFFSPASISGHAWLRSSDWLTDTSDELLRRNVQDVRPFIAWRDEKR